VGARAHFMTLDNNTDPVGVVPVPTRSLANDVHAHWDPGGHGQAASQFPTLHFCTSLNVEYRTPNNE